MTTKTMELTKLGKTDNSGPRCGRMHLRRVGGVAAISAVTTATLILTSCGTDVPEASMEEAELVSTYIAGQDIPDDWSVRSEPTGGVDAGNELEEYESFDPNFCPDSSVGHEIDGVTLAADAWGAYSTERADVQVSIFSTQIESSVVDEWIKTLSLCKDAGIAEYERSADVFNVSVDSLDTALPSVTYIFNEPRGDGLHLVAGQSYGKNHLLIRGQQYNGTPDLDAFEEIVEAVKERFEKGPYSSKEKSPD